MSRKVQYYSYPHDHIQHENPEGLVSRRGGAVTRQTRSRSSEMQNLKDIVTCTECSIPFPENICVRNNVRRSKG